MVKYIFLLLINLISNCYFIANAQKSRTYNQNIDIQLYNIEISVNDSSDIIHAKTTLSIKFLSSQKLIKLDLINMNDIGKGMKVEKVSKNNKLVPFRHNDDILEVEGDTSAAGKLINYSVFYSGKPHDGLIIGKNIYGNRTFFGDNWPDRAKNWIPCIDHPSDKARVQFKIEAPSKYQVVANGKLSEKVKLGNGKTIHTYYSKAPIPTKVMVFGAAEFAIKQQDTINSIPISSWVYPQNQKTGFSKFNMVEDALLFFIERIGPYPFAKLANVQSSTIFGGMENAGTIFYPERRIAGNRSIESTVVHEIAHQWFGNSATETDFAHLWLSEGFATYLTNLYMEHKYGKESAKQLLDSQRKRVINFYKRNKSQVVDTLNHNYMNLLNANSYQKGSWILHMLRKEVGDDKFWLILKKYYKKYKLANASSKDFIDIAEQVSGQKLNDFFEQWLYQSGHPKLRHEWDQKDTELTVNIKQVQKNKFTFKFPLDISIIYEDNSIENRTIKIDSREYIQSIKLSKKLKVKNIIIDPDMWLLFEKG